ncbi:hypothetical protein AKJ63_02185 [candidate division MSBL1 archaeon SCGC-AAA259D18]|uniref:Uncharacterized protein n=1 Tax=candidate division MSBL1 archaeon SCGC-AAA259D18 TaxID=1698262 RepID=A0A133U9F2_9EURY|nr:hypothetical protein AKJ63_02185 [candidate division MSBL1 archaeon SCGC-AAA259D18]
MILALPLAVGITILSKDIILFLLRVEYLGSVGVLQILAWSMLFIYLNQIFTGLLESIDQQAKVTKQAGIALAGNVILNIFLIPTYGAVGAAVSTVVTEFITLGVLYYYVGKYGYGLPRKIGIDSIKVVSSCIPMAVLMYILSDFSVILVILLAIVVYSGLLFITEVFDDYDKKIIREKLLPF